MVDWDKLFYCLLETTNILTTDATNGRSRGKAGGKEHGIKDITEIPVLLEISVLPLVRMIYI